VVPLRIDITDPEAVVAAAAVAGDATLLINNAGIDTRAELLDGDLGKIRLEMETHYFGTLQTARAFVPVIEANGGGGVLNVLSRLSWVHVAPHEAYAAAKAARWAMTNVLRLRLAPKASGSPCCTSATWTPTWSRTSISRREMRPWSPLSRWTACRPAPTRWSRTRSVRTCVPGSRRT
jgi:NAD(P)-dependent dehydrogenase (short-subunit alcohol dehydrogenase family)